MLEEDSFQMITVLTKLEIFNNFVLQQLECWQFVHILCRLDRARDSQAEIIPDKADTPCQIKLPLLTHRTGKPHTILISSPKHGGVSRLSEKLNCCSDSER